MKQFLKKFSDFFFNEDAQSMTEFILIIVCVVLASILALKFYGWVCRNRWLVMGNRLYGATNDCGHP